MKDLKEEEFLIGVISGKHKTTQFFQQRFKKYNLGLPDVVASANPNVKKGRGILLRQAAEHLRVSPNEILLLGDSKYDIFEAWNGGALPAVALYAKTKTLRDEETQKYGFPVERPQALVHYIHTFGRMKAPYFGWSCELPNGDQIYALLYQHSPEVRALLKKGKDAVVLKGSHRDITLSQLLFHNLAAAIFHSGIRPQYVTVYPSHEEGKLNPMLSQLFAPSMRRVIRLFPLPSEEVALLQRKYTIHKSHKLSGSERRQKPHQHLQTQLQSLSIPSNLEARIRSKTILVLDDFTTTGISFEAARHLLHKAGADKVIGIAIGKFRESHIFFDAEKNRFLELTGKRHAEADERFQRIMDYYSSLA